jgi:hypothetical protein
MRRPRRSLIVAFVVAALAIGVPAFAYWTVSSTNVTGKVSAHGLVAPAGASAAAQSGSVIRVSYTPSTQTVSAARYRITRQTPTTALVCTVDSSTTFCDDGGLLPGTTYSYTVVVVIPGTTWTSTAATASATTQVAADTTAPVLQTLQFFDNNTNGKIDQIVAAYNENLNTAFPGAWTATGLPAGAALGTIAVSSTDNKLIVIAVTEGAVDTAVGTIKLTLANSLVSPASNLPRDAANNTVAPLTNSVPTDKAAPVPVTLATGGTNNGKMQTGDTFSVAFSEPMDTTLLPTDTLVSVTETDGGASNDTLSIPSLLASTVSLGDPGYVTTGAGTTAASTDAKSSWSTDKKTVTVTLQTITGTAATGGNATFTYTPATSLKDPSNNSAAGSKAWSATKLF